MKSSHRHYLWAFLGFSSLVLFFFHSTLFDVNGRVIAGSQVGGVFVWEFWWFKKCLFGGGGSAFFTRHLMFPDGVPVIIQAPVALALGLLLQIFLSPFAAVNAVNLIYFVLCGWSMYALVFHLTKDPLPSFLGGTVFMFSHYALTEHLLGHLGESGSFFVPLMFLGADQGLRSRTGRGALLFSVGAIGSCLTDPYVAFAALVVGLPAFLLLRKKEADHLIQNWPAARFFAAGLFLAGVSGAVVYAPIIRYAGNFIGASESSSLSLLSFLDYPAWHPSAWIQFLRHWTSGLPDPMALHENYVGNATRAFLAKPEDLLGFFGLTTLLLILAGVFRKGAGPMKPWLILFFVGVVLALGPWLEISYRPTRVPLPYLVFKFIPGFQLFRTPSRMVLLCWLALSVMAAYSFQRVTTPQRPLQRCVVFVLFLFAFLWEMGVGRLGQLATPVSFGPAVSRLRQSPVAGALLELPVAISQAGDISINAQEYMLNQPLHGRPLVVGRPPRHTRASLAYCESTDVVYELTHPVVIRRLYADEKLRTRLKTLKQDGARPLKNAGIRFVLFHNDDSFFSPTTMDDYRRFLRDVLGAPTLRDGDRLWLYEI